MKTNVTYKELTKDFLDRLTGRPLPFKASFHGDSTIIVDAEGRWVTQQVPQDQAEQIAASMTDYLTQSKDEPEPTNDRQANIIREFKARYHEMGNRIAFLEGKLEACKPIMLELASCRNIADCRSLIGDAEKLIRNWPSEALFALFNQDSILEKLKAAVPKPPNAITWEQGVYILNLVQEACWKDSPL